MAGDVPQLCHGSTIKSYACLSTVRILEITAYRVGDREHSVLFFR